jgi:hypothetical protein
MKCVKHCFVGVVFVALTSASAIGVGPLSATDTSTGIKTSSSTGFEAPPVGENASARVGTSYNFNVAGIESRNSQGDPDNVVINFDLAAALGYASGTPLTLNGIGWSVTLTAEGGSWQSDIGVYLDDNVAPDFFGVYFNPGIGVNSPGEGFYSSNGVVKLASDGIADVSLPNGVLRMEFYEGFDDVPGRDGVWKSGTLTLQVIEVCDEPVWCSLDGFDVAIPSAFEAMRTYDVKPGDVLDVMEICALSGCGFRARVEMFARPPFMEPAGHRKGGAGEQVCISTKANDVVEPGFAEGTYWAKFKCVDLGNGNESILKVGYRYTDPGSGQCAEAPLCEVLEGTAVTVEMNQTTSLTVCGESLCDDCEVTVELASGPPFVTLATADVPGNDDGLCNSYNVSPGDDDGGISTATFVVTDCNGNTSECSVEINVPEVTPVTACVEDEAQSPNGTFADANVIDSGACADDLGVNIHGVLGVPMVIHGDADYYRIIGLSPGATYTAMIIAGLDSANNFTDTMLGWFVAAGAPVAADDNSGSRSVYSMLDFTADGGGSATLAVAGHGDGNFDGLMDPSMPYEQMGRGGYVLSIRARVELGEMPLERRADFNGDGVVDTADLGMLIGIFGATPE